MSKNIRRMSFGEFQRAKKPFFRALCNSVPSTEWSVKNRGSLALNSWDEAELNSSNSGIVKGE